MHWMPNLKRTPLAGLDLRVDLFTLYSTCATFGYLSFSMCA